MEKTELCLTCCSSRVLNPELKSFIENIAVEKIRTSRQIQTWNYSYQQTGIWRMKNWFELNNPDRTWTKKAGFKMDFGISFQKPDWKIMNIKTSRTFRARQKLTLLKIICNFTIWILTHGLEKKPNLFLS